MGSFKLRLVGYFVLLSLVPLAGVTWAFTAAAGRNELQRADQSLTKSVRSAVGTLTLELNDAAATAASLARSPDVQRALQAGDRAALARAAEAAPGASFWAGGELLAGTVPELAASRAANVVDGTETLGAVRVAVPLDDALLMDLREYSGLQPEETLALVVDGRIVSGLDALLGQPVPPIGEKPLDARIGDETYRAVQAALPVDATSASLLALTPRSAIQSEVTDVNLRLVLAALGSIAIVAAVAFLPGRAIVGALRELGAAARAIAEGRLSERVPVRGKDEFAQLGQAFNDMASQLEGRHAELTAERERVRRALERLGTALTASHEPGALLGVVAESALEATGAVGVQIMVGSEEAVRAGTPEGGGEPVEVALSGPESDEHLVLRLFPQRGGAFGQEALTAARSLAAQAATGVENARLHRMVARQAVTDDLTQLANRRRFEESLDHEVSRVQRFGGALSLIVADLDDFKAINDRFGHQRGDQVLREFADVVRSTVRSVDISARPGGEEFAVILPGTELGEACVVADRLRTGLAERRVPSADGDIAVTASFGVAGFAESMSAPELFAVADRALYEAKARGKNRVVARQGPVDTARTGATTNA